LLGRTGIECTAQGQLGLNLHGFKESGMAERFRLIYLKSTEPEKTGPGGPFPSRGLEEEEMTASSPSPSEPNGLETFSSRTVLNQVRIDLKHPDPKVRIFAIRFLEKVGPSVAMPLLLEILSDRDARVRAHAITALGRLRDPSVSPLLKKFLKDTDPGVRVAALRGMFRNKGHLEPNLLLQFMSDESTWVRRKVATLLGWTQTEGVFPVLTELSRDPDSTVRQAALLSLITLYSEEGEDRLIEAAGDPDPALRKWAISMLEKWMARPLKGRKTTIADRKQC